MSSCMLMRSWEDHRGKIDMLTICSDQVSERPPLPQDNDDDAAGAFEQWSYDSSLDTDFLGVDFLDQWQLGQSDFSG